MPFPSSNLLVQYILGRGSSSIKTVYKRASILCFFKILLTSRGSPYKPSSELEDCVCLKLIVGPSRYSKVLRSDEAAKCIYLYLKLAQTNQADSTVHFD